MDDYEAGFDHYYNQGLPLPADASEDFAMGWRDGRAAAQAYCDERGTYLSDDFGDGM